MLVLMQFVVMSGALLVVCLISAWTLRMSRSARRRYDERWLRRGRELGFEVHGEPSNWTLLRYRVDGVDLEMSKFAETLPTRKGTRSVTRAVIRTTVASPWSDAALVKDAPAFFGLGHLTELRFEPWFGFRIFAARPEEVGTWLSPSTRAAIASTGIVRSISVQSRVLSVVLEHPPGDPAGASSLMQIASAIHRGGASAPVVGPIQRRPLVIHAGSIAWVVASMVGFLAFLVGPWFDPVVRELSPLVCDDGDASVVVRRMERGRTSFDRMCDHGYHSTQAGPLGTLAVGAVTGTGAFTVMFVLVFGLAKMASRRAEDL